MNAIATQELTQTWHKLQSYIPIGSIYTEQQYNTAVKTMNQLLDIVQDDETHPLYNLLDTLSILVQVYEENHYPAPNVTGIEVLKFLMVEHGLSLSSFPEIGNESIVSDLLTGKQDLEIKHIRVLAQRFGLSPLTFL